MRLNRLLLSAVNSDTRDQALQRQSIAPWNLNGDHVCKCPNLGSKNMESIMDNAQMSIERIENLIRVVSQIPDAQFDIRRWYDPVSHCGCAIGHALHDEYFLNQGFSPALGTNALPDIAKFFDISALRASAIFISQQTIYETRQDMLMALRVLLLEKMAQELPAQLESMAEPELV
jgi:hypothetical protein